MSKKVASEVEKIAEEIKALSPSGQLRLAADLIDRRQNLATAKILVDNVAGELAIVLLSDRARR